MDPLAIPSPLNPLKSHADYVAYLTWLCDEAPPTSLVVLEHGTSRRNAEGLLRTPPNPGDSFSAALAWCEYRPLGDPADYARARAANAANQTEPCLLQFEVPVSILRAVLVDAVGWFIARSGEIQFCGDELGALRGVWSGLTKRLVGCRIAACS